jgi:hypothetical protein
MADDNGYLANHPEAVRNSEDSFWQFASKPWLRTMRPPSGSTSKSASSIFRAQVAGPASL